MFLLEELYYTAHESDMHGVVVFRALEALERSWAEKGGKLGEDLAPFFPSKS